jgi:glycosyltransferase involved in cell wall biosynthesis
LLLGLTETLGSLHPERPFISLLSLLWDHDNQRKVARLAEVAREYLARYPKHRIVFLCNTEQELARFGAAGAEAFLASHAIFASEDIFRPLPDVAVEFDAVYNARPVAVKRHQLAAEIERVVYISYLAHVVPPEARTIIDQLVRRKPMHLLVNEVVDGLPRWIDKADVNRTLARAAVGLCLSEVEGVMYASIEYLLAGLPVVSTPSRGGRDVFYDPDYCVIADADPRAIREAVEGLRDRNVPRDYVRTRTLAKLTTERHRFVAFLERIRAEHRVARTYETRWPFSGPSFQKWKTVSEHVRDLGGE